MGFAVGGDTIDVVNTSYVSNTLSVSTTEAEVKVGESNLASRQFVIIHNPAGNDTIYYGPTGVTTSTGIPMTAGETLSFPYGEGIHLFLIKAGATQTVRVQELA